MADFKRVKYENPKLKQSPIANQLGWYKRNYLWFFR